MLLLRSCEGADRIFERRKEFVDFAPFFGKYRDLFVKQFVLEIRKSGHFPVSRVKVVLPLLVKIYDRLADFTGYAEEPLFNTLKKLERFGLRSDFIMLHLLRMLLSRYLDDHRDDPLLMGNVSKLADYFDTVLHCLHRYRPAKGEGQIARESVKKEELEHYFVDGRKVGLFNIYKGIPISYRGIVKRAMDGSIRLVVPKEKGVAAEWEGQILIENDEKSPRAILAKIKRVGFDDRHAYIDLERFWWSENYVGRRRSVRVMVERPIKAKLVAPTRPIELDLIDLSPEGICLEGSAKEGLPEGEFVEVELPIPQDDGTVRLLRMRGELRYISKSDLARRRYHIHLYPDEKKEQILAAFVRREEMRLLRELKEKARMKF